MFVLRAVVDARLGLAGSVIVSNRTACVVTRPEPQALHQGVGIAHLLHRDQPPAADPQACRPRLVASRGKQGLHSEPDARGRQCGACGVFPCAVCG